MYVVVCDDPLWTGDLCDQSMLYVDTMLPDLSVSTSLRCIYSCVIQCPYMHAYFSR